MAGTASPQMIEVYDYDGNQVLLRLSEITQVRKPSGHVHDNGSCTLSNGRHIAFGNGDYATRVWNALVGEDTR